MDVSDVLRDRMQTPAGLQRMLTVSVAVHLTLAAALLLASGGLLKGAAKPSPIVMTISIAGSGGPENGGMTPMGGQPVQTQTRPEELAKRAPIRPAAVKAPEMTVPLPNTKPVKATPSPLIKQAPDDARGKTPTRGAQTSAGSTAADTGVRGQGFGLSTGGGPGTGSSLDITGDFCCPEYVTTMIVRIRAAWNQNQGATGQTLVKFTIMRDGSITKVENERPSGTPTLDLAALRAVLTTKTLPPLPDAFPNPTLTVHLNFQYQ